MSSKERVPIHPPIAGENSDGDTSFQEFTVKSAQEILASLSQRQREFLEVLIDNHPSACSYAMLQEILVVERGGLHAAVSRINTALKKTASSLQIKNIKGFGYSLTYPGSEGNLWANFTDKQRALLYAVLASPKPIKINDLLIFLYEKTTRSTNNDINALEQLMSHINQKLEMLGISTRITRKKHMVFHNTPASKLDKLTEDLEEVIAL